MLGHGGQDMDSQPIRLREVDRMEFDAGPRGRTPLSWHVAFNRPLKGDRADRSSRVAAEGLLRGRRHVCPVRRHRASAGNKSPVCAAIDEALKCKQEGNTRTIVFNLTGHGNFDISAYADYFAGKLEDRELDQQTLDANLAECRELRLNRLAFEAEVLSARSQEPDQSGFTLW